MQTAFVAETRGIRIHSDNMPSDKGWSVARVSNDMPIISFRQVTSFLCCGAFFPLLRSLRKTDGDDIAGSRGITAGNFIAVPRVDGTRGDAICQLEAMLFATHCDF
jgi:hypothetical protein